MIIDVEKSHIANIRSAEFIDYLGLRRLKHGGMAFKFKYNDMSWTGACHSVEAFFKQYNYERATHYNISAINHHSAYQWSPVRQPFVVNFIDDETFVMAKMVIQDV